MFGEDERKKPGRKRECGTRGPECTTWWSREGGLLLCGTARECCGPWGVGVVVVLLWWWNRVLQVGVVVVWNRVLLERVDRAGWRG